MSSDKYIPTSDGKEIINPDRSNISKIEPENHKPKEIEGYHISKDTIPSFKKILVTDDGKDISNKALNYAVSLSNSTGAELYILRILKDVEQLGDVSLEGSHESSKIDNYNFHRNIKGDVIDAMEEKLRNVKQLDVKIKFLINF
ncbi:MAG TPA: universal stress protein [Nitrososphaeraceae archaeon]|nr:universal stress protein [Nitrososphaeraceae archaeon]